MSFQKKLIVSSGIFITCLLFASCTQTTQINTSAANGAPGVPSSVPTFVIARVAFAGSDPELSFDRAIVLAIQFKQLMKRVSYGQLDVEVIVTDPLRLPYASSYYTTRTFYRLTRDTNIELKRAHPEIDTEHYLAIYSERVWGSAQGKGTINGTTAVLSSKGAGLLPEFTAHEMGHAFGFDHSGSYFGPYSNPTGGEEYGDILHIMGGYHKCYQSSGFDSYYHPWRAMILGWIPESNIKDASQLSGNVELTDVTDPNFAKPGNISAVVVRKDEYQDYWLIQSHGKIFVHQVHHILFGERPKTNPVLTYNVLPVETTLFDFTPNSSSELCADMEDANLGIGQTFQENDIAITPVVGTERLQLNIQTGANAVGFNENRISQFVFQTIKSRPSIVSDQLTFEVKLPPSLNPQSVEIKLFNLNDTFNAYVRRLITREPPALASSGPLPQNAYRWTVDPSRFGIDSVAALAIVTVDGKKAFRSIPILTPGGGQP